MSNQLPLIKERKKNIKWFSDLQEIFDFKDKSGWPDKFSEGLRRWSSEKEVAINTLSLFSGGGGLDVGFHDAGFRVLEMVEFEKKYTNTLDNNSEKWFDGTKVNCIDIREYLPESLDVDFIIGGPPCQTFSAAGRRAKGVMGVDDPRGNLFKEYVRLLETLKPKAFLFENVYALIGAQKGKPWRLILEGFQSVGYRVHYKILDAADYGVPQHRERIFIVGIRNDIDKEFLFPFPTHGPDSPEKTPFYSAGKAVKTVKSDEKPKLVNGKYGNLLDGIPPGLNYSFYTQKMGHPNPVFGWRSKFSDFLYKADPEKPVRAIKAHGGQYTGPFSWENRFFHLDELKRLQTFPDSYEIVGTRNVIIEQIGNSVPPQIARMLALAVLDQIFEIKLPIKIPYMKPGHELGFRTRKRQLTKEYNQKAKEAIELLKHKGNGTPNFAKIPSIEEVRYLITEKLNWKKRKDKNAQVIFIKHSSNVGVWEIKAASKDIASESQERYRVIVQPKIGWKLPYRKVILHAYSEEDFVFTALWKSFEEKVAENYGYADLVQLFGYYQYESNIQAKFESVELTLNGVWRLISHILNSGVPGDSIHIEELAERLIIEEMSLVNYLIKAKKMGYEIRNSLTNPQIEEDYFLIPYIYPTLNNRSVQLSKNLF
jgi:DNA (cytosine-5)-methyltransferase 1